MPATIEAFINNRATMLANVFLTRKPTVQVNRLDVGHVQLLVNEAEANSVRSFGVILWGTGKKLANEEDATKYANSHWSGGIDTAHADLPRFFMPILVLVFSVEEDLGYYAWAWEPSLDTPSHSVTLRKPERLTCTKIHSNTLDKILSQVGAWYDAMAQFVFVDE
jgi:hypothetical protein